MFITSVAHDALRPPATLLEETVSILCRLVGHQPSHSRVQRDPKTLGEYSVCKRCGAALVHPPGEGWQEHKK